MTNQVTEAASNSIASLITELGDLLIDPMNMIPLILAFGIGRLYSLSPHIVRMKRLSDKKFHVYLCNAIVSGIGFIALNYHVDPRTLMASLMLVVGASILLPAAYFRWAQK